MECIVLAGGLGTRLQGIIGPIPKCMAPIAGQPFLHYLFKYLEQQQCSRIILSLGFRHEMVLEWLQATDWSFEIATVVEPEPLGTGGGIGLAMEQTESDQVIVLNGDTMFRIDLAAMMQAHKQKMAATTIALKSLTNFNRYGLVCTGAHNAIIAFEEKKQRTEGTINGGIYIIDKKKLNTLQLARAYSFEKDYLERFVASGQFYAFHSTAYFIDIGVPEDYAKAQADFIHF